EALSDFLINEMEIPRTIADIIYHGTKVSTALNDEYRQLWETIISVLESMHAALKGQDISPSDYTAVLGSVFGKTLIAKPPQVLDAVTVGDLRRTRTADVKVVFLMGANQGNFPRSTFTSAEFTEAEAEELGKSGIFIEENRSNRYYREKFIIHRALTLPTEKLYITAPLRDAAWKEKKPAKIITGQKEKIRNASLLPLSFWASHKDALKFRAAEKPAVSALLQALSEADPQEHARLFGENRRHNYLHRIAPEAAELLMKKAGISPGRIETLNTCMFKYFCAEGLRIGAGRIKNGTKPDALTRGSMTHYVLENTLTEYADDDYKRFLELDPQDFVKIAKKYIAEFEEAEFFGGYARSKRKKEILLMHAEGIAEVLRQIREDMMMSGFRPFAFEKKFEFMLGNQLIKGKADRLDVLKSADNSRYFRIIDYKTGSKKFSYPEIEYGLNLQALIYLFAITALEKDAVPSGAFYRLVNGGRLTGEAKPYGAADTDTDLYKNRLETQSTTGLHFGDVSREDYSDIEKINSSLKQKADAKKEFIKLENLSEDDFTALTRSVAEQLEEKLLALYGGDVRAVPFYSGTPPCLYCDYSQICGRDGKNDVKISAKKEVPE
ncbi:MAG: PD-(D/E)XK nuclease family protein, partial [Oscillospiraceae bacterium]|nr:PD-(D/E)XK nuclease family protein [Oscillospiraceae bacterium]